MAAAGTLLSDLDGSGGGGGGDGDLVQKILSDMNISSDNNASRSANVPPPLPAQSYNQMASSTQPMTMDSRIPTSHMIGSEHPTPADFAAAMAGYAAPMPSQQASQQPVPGAVAYESPSKNMYGTLVSEIKIPFLVAILFFIFSLPPIRVLVAHYMPALIKATGEFHISGLFVISGMVGMTFWFLQRIIAPLLSL